MDKLEHWFFNDLSELQRQRFMDAAEYFPHPGKKDMEHVQRAALRHVLDRPTSILMQESIMLLGQLSAITRELGAGNVPDALVAIRKLKGAVPMAGQLRWLPRYTRKWEGIEVVTLEHRFVLQQAFSGADGNIEWRDVPTAEAE